jgi:hypothetical protein
MNNIREKWINIMIKIISPIIDNLSNNLLKQNWKVEYSPKWDGRNKDVAYLEAFGRLLWGITPWLILPDDNTNETILRKSIKEKIMKCIKNGFNNKSNDYFINPHESQNLVDCAYIAQSFIKGKNILWDPLDNNTKESIINVFKNLKKHYKLHNNWILFTAMIETFFIIINNDPDYFKIQIAIEKIDKWYVGDGWYKDGENFHMDYYNSYVIHSMLIDICGVLKNNINKNISSEYKQKYELFLERMHRYSEFLERIISVDGSFPPIGRSITYRTAVFQSLSHTVLIGRISNKLTYGQIKGGLNAVINNFFNGNQNFDNNGYLVLGFNGHQPEIADVYSNSGSMYICTTIFLPLGLPNTHEFWNCEISDWTQKKALKGLSFTNDHYINK